MNLNDRDEYTFWAHKFFGIKFAEELNINWPDIVKQILPVDQPVAIFVMAPGAFFVLAFIVAIIS